MPLNIRSRMAECPSPRPARSSAWWALLCLAVLGLSACATLAQKTPEQIVTERAKARWAALFAGDFEAAYGYYSPGYRSTTSLAQYRAKLGRQRVRWTAAAFESIQCQAQLCHPVFQVDYRYRVPLPGVGVVERSSRVQEDWVLTDDGWYYVPPNPA